MKFKIDENLSSAIAELFTRAGHDAVSVLDQKLGGKVDRTIADVCRDEERAIVTLDLDFSDLRTYPPADYFGIIVMRPTVANVASVNRIVSRIIPLLETQPLRGRLWIVDEHRVRIRGDGADGED